MLPESNFSRYGLLPVALEGEKELLKLDATPSNIKSDG